MADIETLVDAFTTDNTALWTSTSGAVAITGGECRVTVSATDQYEGRLSDAMYELAGSSIFVQVTVPTTDANAQTSLRLTRDTSDDEDEVSVVIENATIRLYYTIAAARVDGSAIPYDPGDFAWLRFSEAGGTITLDASPDATFDTPIVIDTVATATAAPQGTTRFVSLVHGTFNPSPPSTTAVFDNVNVGPAAASTGLLVELAVDDDPLETAVVWVDITGSAPSGDTKRGRNNELARIDAGSLGTTLDDTTGDFIPGNSGGAHWPNIVPRRRLRVSYTYASTTYRLINAFVESWKATPSGHPDKRAQVAVAAIDGFKLLSGIKLLAPYAEAVGADLPAAYLPLTEGEGATSAGNRVTGGQATVPLLSSKAGPAGSVFGGEKILPYGDPGSSLNLNPASTATRAEILDCSKLSAAYPIYQATWTFECWTRVEQVPGGTQYFLRQQYNAGTGINGFALSLHTDGTVNVSSGSEVDFLATAASIVDNQPHHLVLVYTTGGSHGRVQLWLDGVQIGSTYTLASNPFPFGEQANSINTRCCVGGVKFASHIQNGGLRGLLGHVAFYADDLTSTQIGQHFAAGDTGSPEDEHTRVTFILDRAAWPASLRDLAPGLANTLQPRDWAENTPALTLILDAMEAAGGLAFMAGDGRLTTHNRAHRYNAAVAATFEGSANTDAEIDGVNVSADDANIANTLTVSRAGQGVTIVIDQDSIDRYGAIEDTIDLAVTDDDEVVNAANWRLRLFGDPPPRMPTVSWAAHSNPAALFPLLLAREIGDRIRLDDLPDLMPDSPLDVFIESIAHQWAGTQWKTTFELSPAGAYDISTWDTGEWGPGGSPELIWGY